MRFLVVLALLVLAGSAAFASGRAHAQVVKVAPAAAGRVAFEAGKYRDALDHYQRAYELTGAPILLYNIGQAADRLRLDATTLRAFQLYLQRYPDAPNRSEVLHRMAVLEPLVDMQARALAEQRLRPVNERVKVNVAEGLMPSPYTDARRAAREQGQRPVTGPQRDVADGKLLRSGWFWGSVTLAAVVVSVIVIGVSTSH
jgi:tetratricopeptide (TPR) repeat protein